MLRTGFELLLESDFLRNICWKSSKQHVYDIWRQATRMPLPKNLAPKNPVVSFHKGISLTLQSLKTLIKYHGGVQISYHFNMTLKTDGVFLHLNGVKLVN